MQQIEILAVGKLGAGWMREAADDYRKRISPYFKLTLTELSEGRLPLNPSPALIDKALETEAGDFRKKFTSRAMTAALCIEGDGVSSTGLAKLIACAAGESKTLTFLIGSSHGLSGQLKKEADLRISMSAMTFPHQIARLLLLEQIYRAGQILGGGKYHK
ncbi:MAG: 23S rRNA (pseudouridine(1915)-N(3))-methyltransferase RlmH [Oscillospiraceae bacterium]|nr:23S rRNA (pseudouridine(1915)-N(3))-methyltransferase RlmH [Oscillospiraceae bacterium]